MTMGCAEARELLSGYLDGMLAPGERAALEAHEKACAACAAELAELREIVGVLRALPRVPVPVELGRRVRDAVKKEREAPALARVIRWAFPEPQGRMMLAAAMMAGLAVFVGVGVFVFGPGGPPRDRAAEPAGASDSEQARPKSERQFVRPAPAAAPVLEAAPAAEARDEAPAPDASGMAQPMAADKLEKQKADASKDMAAKETKLAAPEQESARALGYLEESGKKRAQAEPARPSSREEAEAYVEKTGERRLEAEPPAEPQATPASKVVTAPAAPPPPAPAMTPTPTYAPVPEAAAGSARAPEEAEDDRDGAKPRANEGGALAAADEGRYRMDDGKRQAEASPPAKAEQAKGARTAGDRAVFQVDTSTGWFRREAPAGSGQGRRQGGLFASLEPGTSDASGPLMRLTFPTDGWKERLESTPSVGPSHALPGAPMVPPLELGIEVRGRKCEPGVEGGAGSDARPLPVVDDVAAPVLHEGQTPAVNERLAGSTAVFDVVVRQDGSVSRVELAPGGNIPSGAGPEVSWAIYRWRFTPGTCDGAPVATRFRVLVRWERRR